MNMLPNKPVKPPRISAKRKRFADAYLKGMSEEKAYVTAGYAANTAHSNAYRVMANEGVKLYIEFHQKELAKRNEIKLDEIVFGIREVINNLKPKKPYQAIPLLRAYELLAKMGGYLRDSGVDPDQRPSFVGISINMGNEVTTMKHISSTIKESSAQSRGNSGGTLAEKCADSIDIIDVRAASK